MRRQMLAVALALCIVRVGRAETSPDPITSSEQLVTYLKVVPLDSSPLRWFSPGARKRFLAELSFAPGGLKGIPMDDASHELTHDQAEAVLGLFGVSEYANGLGISSAQQARLTSEKLDDARARGCELNACPESDVELRFDALSLAKEDFSLPDGKRFALDKKRYDDLFGQYQNDSTLHELSKPDLRLLKRAVERAVYMAPDAKHIDQLYADLQEMHRRGMTEDADYRGYYRALLVTRQFERAKRFVARFPGASYEEVPRLEASSLLLKGYPTAITLDDQGHAMIRQAFDVTIPLRIVVVASCHFSQDAAKAIQADAELQPIFAQHAIWLASQDEAFDAVRSWNHQFPTQPIHIAWSNDEWPMLTSWAMPTFYIFRYGRIEGMVSGWINIATLKAQLKGASVLP